MTFPFFKSTLDADEAFLASLILDNFNLKRDLIEFDRGYFQSQDVTEETDIELTILSIAILCIHRPNFISDKCAEIIERIFWGVITWLTKFHHKYTSTVKEGQLYFARTKFETYKLELQHCISKDQGYLPRHIYSSIFHYPLQNRLVEENVTELDKIKDFNDVLFHLISTKYTEVAFKCFEKLHPSYWYVFNWDEYNSEQAKPFTNLDYILERYVLDSYRKEKQELIKKYKETHLNKDS
jgi:hypothetical protein